MRIHRMTNISDCATSARVPVLIDVISVFTRPEFQLDIEFKNGERRRFDMRPLLSMKPWNRIAAPALLERVSVDYGTLVWPGEVDLVPETLCEDSVALVEQPPSQFPCHACPA